MTGGRAPSSLELIRILSEAGHVVHVAESFKNSISKTSNHIVCFHHIREPKTQINGFIEDLISIIKNESIDLLIPTCEEIFYISKYKEFISEHCEVFVDSFDKLIKLHDKYKFIEYAKECHLSVPDTVILKDKNDWFNIKWTKDKKVIKPVFSRFSTNILFLPDDNYKNIEPTKERAWVAQDYIEGEQLCSFSICRDGKLLAHSVYKSEIRAGKGASIYFENCNHAKIEEWVKVFVSRTNFNGQIAFDFIEDKDGNVFAIECNPRMTSGIHLFRDSEISKVFVSEDAGCVYPSFDKKVSIKMAMLIYFFGNLKNVKLSNLLSCFKESEDALFKKGDTKPFFYQGISFFSIWMKSVKNKTTILEATTDDISWDGEE